MCGFYDGKLHKINNNVPLGLFLLLKRRTACYSIFFKQSVKDNHFFLMVNGRGKLHESIVLY